MVQGDARAHRRLNARGPFTWTIWVGAALAGVAQAWSLAWPWSLALSGWLRPGEPGAWLSLLSMAVWVWLMQRARSAWQAAGLAWLGATAWLATTFWWLYVSMHTYGGLAPPLATAGVLALAAFLALYYAAAGALFWRWREAALWRRMVGWAALWTLAEIARGTWFTGFPWGAVGYAHADSLPWLAPWVGVYGMGAVAAAAAVAVGAWRQSRQVAGLALALAVGLVWPGAGPALHAALPSQTEPGRPMGVTLLQANIAQDTKFEDRSGVPLALQWYADQIGQAVRQPGPQAVIAPETALPLLPQQVAVPYWDAWFSAVAQGPSAVLLGLPLGDHAQGYTNSVWGWTPEAATRALRSVRTHGPGWVEHAPATGAYRFDKHHLVPFGEFVPPFFRWFTELMRIPLGDFARGPLGQPTMLWAGQRIAPHVCYEDLFGEELAAQFRDPAHAPTVLVNVSNIAWFGQTIAIDQHRQISRLRALELQRPLVRATNTGSTVAIDHLGRVTHALAPHTRGVLQAEVVGREGLTPYARWAGWGGLWPLVLVCMALLWLARPVKSSP